VLKLPDGASLARACANRSTGLYGGFFRPGKAPVAPRQNAFTVPKTVLSSALYPSLQVIRILHE
ncbi:hypothetical protein, partial [Klebsiella variicola]|uniref:hypothetical protein n=1 Tax=Klebsiella variicola TaxID=244366 RepID=UPI001C530DD8